MRRRVTEPPVKMPVEVLAYASRRYPLLHVNMPKCACTTIKNLIYFLDTGQNYPSPVAIHADRHALLRRPGPSWREFQAANRSAKICSTFVRAPFARAYSAFNDKIFAQHAWSFPGVRQHIIEGYGGNFDIAADDYGPGAHARNCAAFLRYAQDNIRGDTRHRPDPHWVPQAEIIRQARKAYAIDFIGRIESFQTGLRYLLEMVGSKEVPSPGVLHNPGPAAPYSLDEVMTDEIYTLLETIYRQDLRQFKYN